jgi:hypothetical protein
LDKTMLRVKSWNSRLPISDTQLSLAAGDNSEGR